MGREIRKRGLRCETTEVRKREGEEVGEGGGGDSGHRNISLSIRRERRWMPCLTGALFNGSTMKSYNLAY